MTNRASENAAHVARASDVPVKSQTFGASCTSKPAALVWFCIGSAGATASTLVPTLVLVFLGIAPFFALLYVFLLVNLFFSIFIFSVFIIGVQVIQRRHRETAHRFRKLDGKLIDAHRSFLRG